MAGPMSQKKKMQKPKDTKKTIGRVFRYLSEYKFLLILVAVCIVVSALANVAGTYFLKPIINDILVPLIGRENPDLSGFITMLIIMGCIYIVGTISSYTYSRIMVHITSSTLKRIRTDMFNHMQNLPIRYFDTHTHGEIMSLYTNDTDTLREMLTHSIPQMFNSLLTVTSIFIMMLTLSPILVAVVVLILVVMFITVGKIGAKSGKNFMRQQQTMSKVNGYIEEMIEGQKVVKVFCREGVVKEEFAELNNELCDAADKAHTFANILMPIVGNLGYVLYAVTAITGGLLTVGTGFDLGSLAVFLQYTRNFANPITQISQQFNAVLMALAGAERIFNFLDEPIEEDEGDVTLVYARRTANGLEESDRRTGVWAWKIETENGAEYIEVKGDVRFHDVTFGYVENKTVLHNVSLYAKPGQKIAFVGSTGAGKTTITNLVNRFYDIKDGEITYDGIDIARIRKSDLRRSLGMVLQDTHLFTGTVRENIRYGKLDATDEEIYAAAKMANAHNFIEHLPEGYDTMLTADGANLSQGQRQLLAIARAAVADPPVLILDEATSSIDTRTEALIEKGMDKLMEGRTVFVIAHRLSTVRNSNAIMVLENGEIIERGDHDDLIEQKGRYYNLYTGMFMLE